MAQEREEERRSRGLSLESPRFGLDYRRGIRFEVFVVGKYGVSFLRKMFVELSFRMLVLEFNLGLRLFWPKSFRLAEGCRYHCVILLEICFDRN